jgi:argininosuccinate lyase
MAVHRAHLVMLAERRILGAETARLLAASIDGIEADYVLPESLPEGVEDLYFVFERELEARAGAENAAFLHTARSRNDMDTTVFRLALKRALSTTAGSLLRAIRSASARAGEIGGELTVLYTHGQPANISTVGHYLSSIALELAEDLEELCRAIEAVDRSTMGACAITGTGFDVDRRRVAALLGFEGLVVNTYQAISTSHWLVRPATALEDFLRDLLRVAADLFHKSSCEVGLLVFPDALVQTSSIMPQKRNPVIIEHLRIQAGLALGASAAVRELFRAAPWQDVNEVADAPVTSLLETLSLAESAAALFAEIVSKLRADEDRAREIAADFGVTTTELADEMVRRAGVGFRIAHRACAAFARSGGDLKALRETFGELSGRELPFSDAEIADILDPAHFVEVRRVEGGPAPEGLRGARAELERILGRVEAALSARATREVEAARELAGAWRALLSRD